MNAVGSFVETLAGFIDGLWFALHLHPDSAFEHVADHRARMAVGCRRLAGAVGNFDNLSLQFPAVQNWQSMHEYGTNLLCTTVKNHGRTHHRHSPGIHISLP